MKGEVCDPGVKERQRKLVDDCLDKFEQFWLDEGRKKYLVGDKISVADIMACCELEQPAVAG